LHSSKILPDLKSPHKELSKPDLKYENTFKAVVSETWIQRNPVLSKKLSQEDL
jgi:hypothetical protein